MAADKCPRADPQGSGGRGTQAQRGESRIDGGVLPDALPTLPTPRPLTDCPSIGNDALASTVDRGSVLPLPVWEREWLWCIVATAFFPAAVGRTVTHSEWAGSPHVGVAPVASAS